MGEARRKKETALVVPSTAAVGTADAAANSKRMVITQRERLVLIQVLFHPEEKGKTYEDRRKRRRVSEALGIRRDTDWRMFTLKDRPEYTSIALGSLVDGKFRRAKRLGDRVVEVSPESLDTVMAAIERRGGNVDDEDTLLDLEQKLRDLKDGKQLEVAGPPLRSVSDADEFMTDDEEADADES